MSYSDDLRKYYDNLAPRYEQMIADKEQIDSHATEQVGKLFSRHNITSGSILDIGSGPGNLKNDLKGDFDFTGIDFSPKMLDLAQQRGYKTIEGKIEETLSTVTSKSYDYVVA